MSRNRFKLTDHLLELFDVFKHERKGVLFFSSLIVLVLMIHFSLENWVQAPKISTQQLDSLIAISNKTSEKTVSNDSSFHPRIIDPNNSDTLDWLQLGFSKKQVNSILKYRSAIGGKFKTINHIQKIYVIDSLKFSRIKPYLEIRSSEIKDTNVSVTSFVKKGNHIGNSLEKTLFVFDPNKISYDSLLLLGFYPKQASSLIKYRDKIENFKIPNDLLVLYLYGENDHKKYAPYIEIDTNVLKHSDKKGFKDTFKKKMIELNAADTADLIQIRGVGPYYAAKIIHYRNLLGGYYDSKQLYEIKKIPKERMDVILESVLVDEKQVKKIRINQCEFKELLAHPYFDYYETKLLFDYRNEHGNFIYLQDLNKLDPLPDYYIDKVGHYLIFD